MMIVVLDANNELAPFQEMLCNQLQEPIDRHPTIQRLFHLFDTDSGMLAQQSQSWGDRIGIHTRQESLHSIIMALAGDSVRDANHNRYKRKDVAGRLEPPVPCIGSENKDGNPHRYTSGRKPYDQRVVAQFELRILARRHPEVPAL
jgi:hypothetical protein